MTRRAVSVPIEQLTDTEIDRIIARLSQEPVPDLLHIVELRKSKRVTYMTPKGRLGTDECPEVTRRYLAARAAPRRGKRGARGPTSASGADVEREPTRGGERG